MNKNLQKLLLFNLSTDVVNTFITVFLNLYIWKQGKSMVDLAWFNFSMFFIWMISYTIGAWIIHKTSMKVVFQVANIFTVCLFLVLSFVPMNNPLTWLILIGSCTGFMKGFMSSGKNLGVAAFGEKKEFATYYQYQILTTRTLQIVTPLIFAFLLSLMSYRMVFFVMCGYAVLMIFITHYVPNNEGKASKEPLFQHMFSPFKTKELKLLNLSYLLGGVFSEFQGVFLMVFTFSITESNVGVALLNVAYSVLIMALIYLNKRFNRVNGVHWLFIGASIAFIGFGMMMFLDAFWLVIANFFVVAGNFYFSTTFYSQQFEAMEELNDLDKERMLIWRENLLAFSRMMFLAAIILIGEINEQTMSLIFCVVMIVTVFVPVVHKKILYK